MFNCSRVPSRPGALRMRVFPPERAAAGIYIYISIKYCEGGRARRLGTTIEKAWAKTVRQKLRRLPVHLGLSCFSFFFFSPPSSFPAQSRLVCLPRSPENSGCKDEELARKAI